ncbi:hypothetical protein BC828DRAFT_382397 [Blastocladiella britannica]|nr:hypothetical protein BC828DRAFT_382397 [Blastocladiella britannica]
MTKVPYFQSNCCNPESRSAMSRCVTIPPTECSSTSDCNCPANNMTTLVPAVLVKYLIVIGFQY